MKSIARKNFHKILWFFKYKSTPATYLASNRLIAERSSKDKYIYSLFGSTWGAHSWTTSTSKLLSNRLATAVKYILLLGLLLLILNFPNMLYYLSCATSSLLGVLTLTLTSLYLVCLTTKISTLTTKQQTLHTLSSTPYQKFPANVQTLYKTSSRMSAVSGKKAVLPSLGKTQSLATGSKTFNYSLNKQLTVGLPLVKSPAPQTHLVQSFLQKKNQTQTEIIRWKSAFNLLQPDVNLFLNNYNLLSRGISQVNTLKSGSYVWSLARFALTTKLPSYHIQNLLSLRDRTQPTTGLRVRSVNTPLRLSRIVSTEVTPISWLLPNQNKNSSLFITTKQPSNQSITCSWSLTQKQASKLGIATNYLY